MAQLLLPEYDIQYRSPPEEYAEVQKQDCGLNGCFSLSEVPVEDRPVERFEDCTETECFPVEQIGEIRTVNTKVPMINGEFLKESQTSATIPSSASVSQPLLYKEKMFGEVPIYEKLPYQNRRIPSLFSYQTGKIPPLFAYPKGCSAGLFSFGCVARDVPIDHSSVYNSIRRRRYDFA
ncbi:unnamed protein product [Enterobius vermicularis]|uniref:Uncharacterized protein n=1 Tax=Enterobius vermicularis TaxID=51028 RepID=A0A0N4UVQ9_ENTVE|nr:unnamed protein product [Enterobius vermicularis]